MKGKKETLLLIGLVLFLVIFAFISTNLRQNIKYLADREVNNVIEKMPNGVCQLIGGEITTSNEFWQTNVDNPKKYCVLLYNDAGNSCFDNNDCEGSCVLETNQQEPTGATKGRCQKYKASNICHVRDGNVLLRIDGKIKTRRCPIFD